MSERLVVSYLGGTERRAEAAADVFGIPPAAAFRQLEVIFRVVAGRLAALVDADGKFDFTRDERFSVEAPDSGTPMLLQVLHFDESNNTVGVKVSQCGSPGSVWAELVVPRPNVRVWRIGWLSVSEPVGQANGRD